MCGAFGNIQNWTNVPAGVGIVERRANRTVDFRALLVTMVR
jgi:hypothetical protein